MVIFTIILHMFSVALGVNGISVGYAFTGSNFEFNLKKLTLALTISNIIVLPILILTIYYLYQY